jgi:hypothetical protein
MAQADQRGDELLHVHASIMRSPWATKQAERQSRLRHVRPAPRTTPAQPPSRRPGRFDLHQDGGQARSRGALIARQSTPQSAAAPARHDPRIPRPRPPSRRPGRFVLQENGRGDPINLALPAGFGGSANVSQTACTLNTRSGAVRLPAYLPAPAHHTRTTPGSEAIRALRRASRTLDAGSRPGTPAASAAASLYAACTPEC